MIAKKTTSKATARTAPVEPMARASALGNRLRWLVLLFLMVTPFLYDLAVPEVSGDIRWNANILISGILAFCGLWAWRKRTMELPLAMPVIWWCAALLASWAALSLVDSLNIYRGIWAIKALYAQLLLMVGIALLWRPGWTMKVSWALIIPLAFTSWLGILQFFGWGDATFATMLKQTPGLGWLGGLWPQQGLFDPVWVGGLEQQGGLTGWLASWLPTAGPWNVLLGYYQSSAIPGSSFANKNLAGSYTAMLIPMTLFALLVARREWQKFVASALLALASLFLLYSRARASWLAALVGVAAMVAVLMLVPEWRAAVKVRLTRGFWLALVPAALVVGFFGQAVSPIFAHGITITPAQQMENLVKASWNETGGRVAYNLNGLVILKDYWFNGTGIGSFHAVYPAYHDAIVATPANSYSVVARPQRNHNDMMQAFTEMGVVGGLAFLGIFFAGLWMAWRLRVLVDRNDLPEGERLFPLAAGASLVVLGVNALMDFPLQLPTAPIVVMALLGVLTGMYRHYLPNTAWAPGFLAGKTLRLDPVRTLVLMQLALLATLVAVWDSYRFRQENIYLKAAMARTMAGVVDDQTLAAIDQAMEIYPLDPRAHEYLGVIYANYKGGAPLSAEARIEKLEWVLKTDPWAPNHLINLSGQYLTLAESAMGRGDSVVANRYLAKVDELLPRLERSAGFSHFYWGILGMRQLLGNQLEAARQSLTKAMEITPSYQPAQNGLAIIRQRMGR